jgi:hypothetical protein
MSSNSDKPTPAANGYVLPPEKLEQREKVYQIYQAMGVTRSITRLERVLREKHAELRVARPTLEKWSVQHNWAIRVKAHDDAAGTASMVKPIKSVEEDPVEALIKLANQTLARAPSATPAVTRPNEVKSLIDSATNAMKLAEQIKASQTSKTTAEDVADDADSHGPIAPRRPDCPGFTPYQWTRCWGHNNLA